MANGKYLRGEVYWVSLDDSFGSEIKTGRPAVVISADGLNEKLNTVLVAFLSTSSFPAPTHPSVVSPEGIRSRVLCEQIRAIDKARLVRHDYTLTEPEIIRITGALANVMCIPLAYAVNKESKEKIADLEAEITVLKRLYDKAIDKIVETKLEADISRRVVIAEEPEISVEEDFVEVEVAEEITEVVPEEVAPEVVEEAAVEVPVEVPVVEHEVLPETSEKVNINIATAAEMSAKLGMPIKDAYAITGYRNKNGLFVCLEELKEVSRISAAKYERYKDYITIGETEAAPEVVEETPEIVVEEPEATEVEAETEKVNVNTANIYELMGAGFGKSESGRIVRWVKKYGAFKSLDELTKVDGVTGKLLRKIRDSLEV